MTFYLQSSLRKSFRLMQRFLKAVRSADLLRVAIGNDCYRRITRYCRVNPLHNCRQSAPVAFVMASRVYLYYSSVKDD